MTERNAFCHHSDFVDHPDGEFKDTAHWRNFMSRELFARLSHLGQETRGGSGEARP